MGSNDQSIKSLSVAINLSKESNDLSGLASDYRNLGLALAASGDLAEARKKIATAKEMSLKQGLKYNLAWCLLADAEISIRDKDYKSAIDTLISSEENFNLVSSPKIKLLRLVLLALAQGKGKIDLSMVDQILKKLLYTQGAEAISLVYHLFT